MYRKNLLTGLLCSGLLMGGGQPAPAADGPGRADPVDHAGGDLLGGKWKYHAEATCRCADNSCKVITCDGESGLSYEDARIKASLALQFQARVENGRIEGTPSITIRFEF